MAEFAKRTEICPELTLLWAKLTEICIELTLLQA
jgi:hypothetical protein